MDSDGQVWNFVPVLAFVATDMDEARRIKGTYKNHRVAMPCHICTIKFKDCDKVPTEVRYRNAAETIELIQNFNEETR